MKKYVIYGVLAVLGIVMAVVAGVGKVELDKETQACNPLSLASQAADTDTSSLTVKDVSITPEQMQNAEIIYSVAVKKNLPVRAAEIGIMAAIVESELINVPFGYPGSTSLGLFQQIEAWGPRKVRMNPALSSSMFYTGGRQGQRGLTDIPNWQNLERGVAAQAVQGSAFPDEYAKREAEAIAIVTELSGDTTIIQAAQECEDGGDPIEEMVQAALSRVDQPLDSISMSGTARIATYNVLGSNHTSNESAMNRIATSVALIKELELGVVGLQELRPDQRERMMQLFGSSYDIFPKTPVYGSSQMSANSIIWDTSQFEFVSGKSTPMPYYFGGQELDIPLVELSDIETARVITVANTHDPAKPENARLRYLNALAHAKLGSLFFTGDFNSGFGLRSENNTTYLNDRDNLTWCIMTRTGEMVNGYDDLRGRSGCSSETTNEMGIGPVDHVFVPRDGVQTVDYKIISEGTASDHPVVFAEVAFGESEDQETSDVGTSAEFVSWAASQGGIELPSTIGLLAEYPGDEEAGISSQIIRGADIASGAETLQRGDLAFRDKDGDGIPDDVLIELGSSATGAGSDEFRVGTYNITVKREFANYELAVDNITTKYKMDIVGTQELIGDSYRTVQQRVKAAGYGIYPDYAPGLNTVRHSLNGRAIIYNKERFKLDESLTSMFRHPRYPDDRAARVGNEEVLAGQANVPVLHFTDRATGQPLIVVNFHNVAFARYAKIRYESNLILVEKMRELQASYPGVPIFLTGDFNEGTGVRRPGEAANTTYELKYQNLLYCMFAENGLMMSADAESRGQNMVCPNPSIGGIDYIYAGQEVRVVSDSFTEIAPGAAGSDHPAKFVDVAIPGSKSQETNIAEEWLTSTVGRSGDKVDLISVDTRNIVKVLRLTVTNTMVIASDGDWIFPLKPGDSHFSDAYGLEDGRFHQGADFGTYGAQPPLYAMHGGEILQIGFQEAWGNYIVVETGVPYPERPGETIKYLYAHLSYYVPGLSQGDSVVTGQFVGNVGDTGNSFGAHLHLTMGYDLVFMGGSEVGSAGSEDPLLLMEALGIWPQKQAA